jgi:hypothetical protein
MPKLLDMVLTHGSYRWQMRGALAIIGVFCLTLSSCGGSTVPVYASNPCDRPVFVRFSYDDSTTLVPGGDEYIAFEVPAKNRAEGPHEIGEPATPKSILFLEVYGDALYSERIATHQYNGVVPEAEVDGQKAILLEVPTSACRTRRSKS